jgi:hypothetical protein
MKIIKNKLARIIIWKFMIINLMSSIGKISKEKS